MEYFHDFFPDLFHFLSAVIFTAANLLTGGIVIALLFLWGTFYKPVSKRVWRAVVLLLLLFAFFNSWRDEYKKTHPGLKLDIGAYGFADDLRGEQSGTTMPPPGVKGSLAMLTASARNLGNPTIADQWRLSLKVPGYGEVRSRLVAFNYPPPQTFTFENEIIPTEKLLYKQTMSPVITGDKKEGFIIFIIDGLSKKDVAIEGTTFTLSCVDVNGNTITSPPVIFSPKKAGHIPNMLQ